MTNRIRRDAPPKLAKKPVALPKPPPRIVQPRRDELSNGRGSALRRRGLAASGANLSADPLKVKGPAMSLRELLASRAAGATSLRTEVRGDGKANCLENAVNLAKPGDQVVLLSDQQDPVGHAVVQRADGRVVDPNRPDLPYASLDAFTAANPRYGDAVRVSDHDAEALLATPPGARRNALISKLGLDGVASRVVADPRPTTADPAAGAREVQATYDETLRETGSEVQAASAAAAQLEALATASGSTPEYVAQLTAAAAPTIDAIARTVGQAARDDLDRDQGVMKDVMAHLSVVGERGGATNLARSLARELPNDAELEEIDDGLFEALDGGTQTDLARALHQELLAAGKTDAAKGLADNEHGTDLEERVVEEARALLDCGTDAARQEVLRDYVPYLTAHIGRSVESGDAGATDAAVTLLADLADRGGPEMAASVAHALAQQVPNQSDLKRLDDTLHALAQDGRGVSLSVSLVQELEAAGKIDAASELTDVVTTGIDHLRSEYESAQNDVDALNQELNYHLGNFGPLLTDEQRKAAVDDFMQRHAADYERLEQASQAFASNIDAVTAALGDGAFSALPAASRDAIVEASQRAVINVMPRIGETAAGSKMMSDAIIAGGTGETTFLDRITNLNLPDARVKELASDETQAFGVVDLATAKSALLTPVFQGATLGLLGQGTDTAKLLEGLTRYGGRLGVQPEILTSLTNDIRSLGALGPNANPAEIARLQGQIRSNTAEIEALAPSSRAGQAFRGFATVLGAVNIVNGVANWDEASTQERIGTLATTLETGIGAYELVLGATGNAARIPGFLGPATAVVGGVQAVLSGISATQAFQRGDWVSGTGHSLTAVGSGVLAVAAAASNVVPVWGQVAAGVLLVVGLGLNQWASVQASNQWEGPTEDFLRGAGLSQKLAEELSNHGGDGFSPGPALVAVAGYLGISGEQLFAHLETLSEDALQRFVEGGLHPINPNDGAFPQDGGNEDLWRRYAEGTYNPGHQVLPRPDSIEAIAWFMQRYGLLPAGVSVPG